MRERRGARVSAFHGGARRPDLFFSSCFLAPHQLTSARALPARWPVSPVGPVAAGAGTRIAAAVAATQGGVAAGGGAGDGRLNNEKKRERA
jgi:hypothetical protein